MESISLVVLIFLALIMVSFMPIELFACGRFGRMFFCVCLIGLTLLYRSDVDKQELLSNFPESCLPHYGTDKFTIEVKVCLNDKGGIGKIYYLPATAKKVKEGISSD